MPTFVSVRERVSSVRERVPTFVSDGDVDGDVDGDGDVEQHTFCTSFRVPPIL